MRNESEKKGKKFSPTTKIYNVQFTNYHEKSLCTEPAKPNTGLHIINNITPTSPCQSTTKAHAFLFAFLFAPQAILQNHSLLPFTFSRKSHISHVKFNVASHPTKTPIYTHALITNCNSSTLAEKKNVMQVH